MPAGFSGAATSSVLGRPLCECLVWAVFFLAEGCSGLPVPWELFASERCPPLFPFTSPAYWRHQFSLGPSFHTIWFSFEFTILCSNSGTVMWYSLLRILTGGGLPQWLVMAGRGRLGRNEIMPVSVCLLSPSTTAPLWLVSPVFMVLQVHLLHVSLRLYILISSQINPHLSAHSRLSGSFYGIEVRV